MYKITIDKSTNPEPDDKGYWSWSEVYEQKVEELDLKAVIATVNDLQVGPQLALPIYPPNT